MGLVFKQVYSGSPSSIIDACMPSGSEAPPTGSNGAKWYAAVDASTSNTGRTLTLDGGTSGGRNLATVQCLAQWEGIASDYGSPTETTTWEAGDWICRFNVLSANTAIFWDKVQICAVQGGVYTTIATKTGINTFLAGTGTKSTTITTTEASTVTLGSTIWWGFHFGKDESLGIETFGIRSNKNLATPIENKRAVTVVSLAGAPVLPGTTLGAINVSTPPTTLASGVVVPATTVGGLSAPVPATGLSGAIQAVAGSLGAISVASPVVGLALGQAAPVTGLGGLASAVPVTALSGAAVVPGVGVGGLSSGVVSTGLVAGLGVATPAPGPISVAVGVAGIDTIAVPPSHDGPFAGVTSGAAPACRIVSSGIEVGASVASMVSASRFAGSAAAIGASSSSTLAASRFSWSGQRLGAIPYGALVAGRAFSSEQRLAAIVSPDPVVSRSIQTSAVQGGVGSSGVVAAAISSSGVEVGGVSCAY
jgi:hypothetical protein